MWEGGFDKVVIRTESSSGSNWIPPYSSFCSADAIFAFLPFFPGPFLSCSGLLSVQKKCRKTNITSRRDICFFCLFSRFPPPVYFFFLCRGDIRQVAKVEKGFEGNGRKWISEYNQSRLEHSLSSLFLSKVLQYLFLLSKMIWVPTANYLTAWKVKKPNNIQILAIFERCLGTFAHRKEYRVRNQ